MSARRFALPLAAALLCVSASRGLTQEAPGSVTVDQVRIAGRGHHTVWVSVLDANGHPLAGLEHGITATADGAPATGLTARPRAAIETQADLTVLVDGELLNPVSVGALRDALRAVFDGLKPGDRIRVVGVTSTRRQRSGGQEHANEVLTELPELAAHGVPKLYDALYDAVMRASRLPRDRAGAVLALTRGSDEGSSRAVLDVLAMAQARTRLVPVMVALVEDAGNPGEADNLQRLATRTGGEFARTALPEGLASAVTTLLPRVRGGYVVRFDAPEWRAARERHEVAITAEGAGETRTGTAEFSTEEVVAPPWWTRPMPWLIVCAVVLLGLAGLLALRRRQVCLLVVDSGLEQGVWYEVFGLPLTLGAAAGNDVTFDDPRVSRNHAVLERRGRVIELVDLNSENGTLVNGERIARRALADGDRVSLGGTVELTFEARG